MAFEISKDQGINRDIKGSKEISRDQKRYQEINRDIKGTKEISRDQPRYQGIKEI
jgi:hypothetical protein